MYLVSHLSKGTAERAGTCLQYRTRASENRDVEEQNASKKRSNSEALLKVTGGFAKPSIPNFLEILSARKMLIVEMEEKKTKKKEELRKARRQEDVLDLVERPTRKKYNKEKPKKAFTVLYALLGVRNIFLDEGFQDAPDIEKVQEELFRERIEKNEEARLTIAAYRDAYETYAKKKETKLRSTKSRIVDEPVKKRLLPSIGPELHDF